MEKTKIEELLEEILHEIKILNKKDVLAQIDLKKNLSLILDSNTNKWTSFNPIKINDVRLLGYYYNSAPPQLTEIEEGWIPLRVDLDGKLKVNTT